MPAAQLRPSTQITSMTGSALNSRARRHSAFPAAARQMLVVATIIGATAFLARMGLGPISRLFFLAAGLAAAACYIKLSPWLYLTATMWFWTLAPLTRRLIDYYSGFDPVNIVLAAPNAMAILMLKDILSNQHLFHLREAAAGLLLLVPLLYGLALSFVAGDMVPGAVAAADWIAPVLYYFYLLAQWRRIEEAEPHFRAFITLNMIVVVAYGLHQYVAPTPWDATWVVASGSVELGPPLPYSLRLFGTLNFPSTLAVWLATLLLLGVHFRTRAMLVAMPAAGILLLLTMVRGAVGAVLLGLVMVVLLGRASVSRSILKSLALVAVVVATVGTTVFAFDPETADRISTRFATLGDLQNDASANDRRALYAAAPSMIDAHPLGLGIGALGRGAVVSGNAGLVVVDAGPLAVYLALGWIAGSVYFAGIFSVVAQAISAARRSGSEAALVLAAVVLARVSGYVFANMVGFDAAVAWMCAGYACALGVRTRQAAIASCPTTSRRVEVQVGVPPRSLW